MPDLLSGLLGLITSTNKPVAASNYVAERTGVRIEVTNTNDPVEREYQRLLELDNTAQAEIDKWLTDNDKLASQGAGSDPATMRAKSRQRLEPVEKAYEEFLSRHPDHVNARVAYGSFLNDLGREDDAKAQWEKARQADPNNAAVLNNLGNYYGHNSPVTNAFACYERAIQIAPGVSVYYQNLATTVYMFRRDATNYYRITEQQVFDKAMDLYRKALSLDPQNFVLATEVARTYYGIKPPRVKEALAAWNEAMKLANDDIEREGVHLHLARWHKTAGDFAAAHREVNLVTNQMYSTMRSNVLRTIEAAESK